MNRLTPDDYLDFTLAPCPKCASKAEHRSEGDRPFSFYAVCEFNCVRQVGTYGTKAASARDWNRRPLAEKLDKLLEEARQRVQSHFQPPSSIDSSTEAK